MRDYVFACLAPPGSGARQARLLVQSIRRFGGSMSGCDVWVFMPDMPEGPEAHEQAAFDALRVRVVLLPIDRHVLSFPFAAKTLASATAEEMAEKEQKHLIWMDRDSLILREPAALRLPPEKILGYRPVDHTLIGSPYDSPVDDFWKMVYSACKVPEERMFSMVTSVDQENIRPYFNAGMLVVRPEARLLRSWAANFESLYQTPQASAFYDQDRLYQIFIHQAVLSATILARCEADALQELPYLINYPLHMHERYPAERRPATMNELITCRYDTLFQDADWAEGIAIEEPLKGWLLEHL